MINALTIDVEDYSSVVWRDWLGLEIKPTEAVVRNTEWFLERLAANGVKATFFILGEVVQTFPALVKRIAEQGHELGVHGHSHKQIFKLRPEEFRQEISRCKKALEDTVSARVCGHRAPAFSVMPETQWSLEILAEEGFKYDSSVFPIAGKRYGWPGFEPGISRIELASGRTIIEVPMSTVTVLGKTLPAAGGGYIRHLPYFFTKWCMKRIIKTRPVIVYMHPYEIDTEQRPLEMTHLSAEAKAKAVKFHRMQLRNRSSMAGKIQKLLADFEFGTLGQVIENTGLKESE